MKKITVGLFIFLLLISLSYLYKNFSVVRINSGSMMDTLINGDVLLVQNNVFSKGDIITFYYPEVGSIIYIKRCVAISGDTLYLFSNGFSLNSYKHGIGELIYKETIYRSLENEIKCYTLSDNYQTVTDSRIMGPISRENIIGRAIFILISIDKYGKIDRNRILVKV